MRLYCPLHPQYTYRNAKSKEKEKAETLTDEKNDV